MKLVDFVPQDEGRIGKCTIGVNKKGMVTVSGEACKMIGLSDGDEIVISFDDSNKHDWFIRKGKALSARKLILRKSTGKMLLVNCSSLANAILNQVGPDKKSTSMLISREPIVKNEVKYYPIITRTAK